MIKDGLKIAISGKSGCGNTTVSKRLSQTLDLRMINYTFRNMAQELGMELKELLHLAEQDDSWDKTLDKKQVAMAEEGKCVLGSRLAIWVLKDADLKVFLTASTETRSARIHRRESEKWHETWDPVLGGTDETAKSLVKPCPTYEDVLNDTFTRDTHDRERYLKLYGIDNDDYHFADLVIDTTYRDPNMVLEDIIYALRIKKLVS